MDLTNKVSMGIYKSSVAYGNTTACRAEKLKKFKLDDWVQDMAKPIILFSSFYRAWSDKKRIIGFTLVQDTDP